MGCVEHTQAEVIIAKPSNPPRKLQLEAEDLERQKSNKNMMKTAPGSGKIQVFSNNPQEQKPVDREFIKNARGKKIKIKD